MLRRNRREGQVALQEPEEEQEEEAFEPKDPKRERRRTIRHKVRVRIEMLVRVRFGASDDWSTNAVEIKGRLLDLSADGAMLYTRQSFERGQELRLTIFIPDEPRVKTKAVVRWCKFIPDKEGHASGVKFAGVSEEALDIVTTFLKKLDAKFQA